MQDKLNFNFVRITGLLWLVSFCLSLPVQVIANTVNSASEPDYSPFSIVLEDGSASGFSVELMKEALMVMGHKVTYEVRPWSEIKQDLEQGKLDALPLVGRTPEREKLFDFSSPYIRLYGAIFVRNDENNINNINDLRGRRVGVMRNDNAEEFMLREHITDQLISTSSFKDAFLQLSTGTIDAVVVQRLVGISLIDELKLNNIKTALAPLKGLRQDFCFAVTKGNKELLADLNEGLSIVIVNKTYDQLHSKWLGILSRDKEKSELFWIIINGIISFIAAILLCLYFYQKRQAHKQLKASEEHLRISQLYGNIGTWEADFITNKEIWSEAVTNTLGFPKVAEPTWDLYLETIHPEDRDHVLTIIDGHLNEGKVCDVEYRIIDTEGKIRWMRSVGKAEFDSNGKPLKLRGTVQEISDLKRAEHEVSIRTEELTKAVQIKSDFLSNMSHEIRTPMNAIIGMTHLALRTDLNAQQNNYLSKIDTSAKWLMGILNDILDFSKLEAGKIKLEHIVFKLDSVICYLMDMTSASLNDKQLELKLEIDDNVSPTLEGDPLRLGQVLLNLLNNAIKFTHSGSITISIQVISSNKTQQELKFSVTDTGIGLSDKQQVSLFNAFDQADNSTTRLYGGTGLGLAICKQLVEAMNGSIGIKSRLGFGSTFYFTLPMGIQTINEANQTPAIRITTPDKYSVLNNAHLLLVEDNLINQEMLQEMLTTQGIQVDIANNGAEAVMMVKQNNYAAVLMDCQMPVMDGFEATRIIRNFPRYTDLPIIAMTANVMKKDQDRCLASGMNSHLSKPIEWEKLFQTLAHWVKPAKLPNIPTSSIPTTETRQQDWTSLVNKLPGFDLKNLMTGLRVDKEKTLHLLDLYREQLILEGPEIINNIATGNLTEAQIGLHRLQGSNVYLGAKELSYACITLEAELENGQYDALKFTHWQEIYNKTIESLNYLQKKSLKGSVVTVSPGRLELMADVMALLLTDSFINDQQLDQLKTHAPDDQQIECMLLDQSIVEGDYPKALSVLNELMQKESGQSIDEKSEFIAPSVKPCQIQSGTFTILVVDDTRVDQEVLVSLLNEEYQVKVASNGMRALAIAQKLPHPDLILLDATMPLMDGHEVCRRLQNNPDTHDISVIFVTAACRHESETLGLKLGAVDYISKPINPDATLLRIRHQLRLNEHNRKLEHIAHYDALTDIPNRVLLTDRLKHAIAQSKREQKKLAICYIDLDEFKPINDTLGHQTGDDVLIEIAQRINSILRDSDTAARTGGDEFVVLLSNLESQEECKIMLKRLHKTIAKPISIQGQSCSVTATIGISVFPTDGSAPEVLLDLADQAMYIAKQSGKNHFHFFNSMPHGK